MPYEKSPMIRICSLWETRKKRDDGTEIRFWSGPMGQARVIMFRSKSTHAQAPMFDVYITPSKKKDTSKSTNTPKDNDDFKPDTAQPAEEQSPSEVNEQDKDLPF